MVVEAIQRLAAGVGWTPGCHQHPPTASIVQRQWINSDSSPNQKRFTSESNPTYEILKIPRTPPGVQAVGHGVYFALTVEHAAQRPTEQLATKAMHRYLVLISWTWSYDVEIPRREQYPLVQRNGAGNLPALFQLARWDQTSLNELNTIACLQPYYLERKLYLNVLLSRAAWNMK
jgi:hypothetical protein